MAGSLFDSYMPTTEAWKYLENRQKIGAGMRLHELQINYGVGMTIAYACTYT